MSYGFPPFAWVSSVTQKAPTWSVVISWEIKLVGGVDGPSVRTTACFGAGVDDPRESWLGLYSAGGVRDRLNTNGDDIYLKSSNKFSAVSKMSARP